MEDITLGLFTKTRSSHARLNVPALVQVAAFAIILIRGLDLLMILNLLGLQGLNEFIHRSVQTWNLTLVFLGSLALVFIEIWCAFSLVMQKLPDLLVLTLLFVPANCRRFFRLQ